MIRVNENYLTLQSSYLFSEIAGRLTDFKQKNPGREIIKLGIGDVTCALPEACIKAFHKAVDEMADERSFHGYGPEQGYGFLREKIALHDFKEHGAEVGGRILFAVDLGAQSGLAELEAAGDGGGGHPDIDPEFCDVGLPRILFQVVSY